jgi:nicotinamide-nucleotide amidase
MEINDLVKQVGKYLTAKKLLLVTAESCTGGMVAEIVTSVTGSSDWFERGFITYSNAAKQELLGVNPETLEKFGAVSIETACEMAEGALANSHAQVSLAITGIAGPGGGTAEKPVGTVCFAWAQIGNETKTKTKHFSGDRTAIRQQAAIFALSEILAI